MASQLLIEEISRDLNIGPQELIRWETEQRGPLNLSDFTDKAVLSEGVFLLTKIAENYSEDKVLRLTRELRLGARLGVPLQGGSFITGTSSELLFASITTGTQLNTFTVEDNLQKTIPPIIVPAGFWYNLSAAGKSLRIKAVGRLGTTGAPTFTFTGRFLTSTTWSAAGVAMSSAAITAGTTVTLAPWIVELDITARSLVDGATGLTLAILGEVRGGTSLAATGGIYSIPAANTAFTVALQNSVSQYFYLSVACGTSNAANLIQLELIKAYGEN